MYNKTALDNGIRIVTEEINHVRSVSLGVWVESGSRYEDSTINGIAHCIEHMLFKGTKNRSALDIVSSIDSVGGIMNAYTGKELTSFYVKIPDYHLAMAIDLLADIFQNSLFDPAELDKEKLVILQEIHMLEDTPDEYIYDFFGKIFWDDHPLGLPILGTKDTVTRFLRNNIVDFFTRQYNGNNMTIAAAGNLKHDDFVSLVEQSFSSIKGSSIKEETMGCTVTSNIAIFEKDLEQVHVMIGTLAPASTSDDRYTAVLMNTILGGSMSSRLFQEIREKRGLAYTIHSFLLPYYDVGMLGIYFGASEDRVTDIITLVMEELKKLSNNSLLEREIQSAKEQMKGNFLLSMESTDIRMTRLAKNEIYFSRNIEFDEVVEHINGISKENVKDLAGKIFRSEILSMAVLGRVKKKDFTPELLM
ncbi:MAG: insulinase family protein [Deltaproteobacteria bacterium]|nr:insulinase family protein [Deltaproteobacteria bacterium]